MAINLYNPDQQIDFAVALIQMRDTYLQSALFAVVKDISIKKIDEELIQYVPSDDLSLLASKGLRGEVAFAVPAILTQNPYLIGYYRLLNGYSQKAFCSGETGLSFFKRMEEKGTISKIAADRIPELCKAINTSASYLLNGLAEAALTLEFLDDLSLLTLGPQLRGGANVKKGARGIVLVFDAIQEIVEANIVTKSPRMIVVQNSAGRRVLIEFTADPDIIIREAMTSDQDSYRNIIAIEVKAGTDFSNIHNRIGEAEKIHQKAKANGYTECWTVVNVDRIDTELGAQESPSTNRFYRLSQIIDGKSKEYEDFRNRIVSLTGIPSSA